MHLKHKISRILFIGVLLLGLTNIPAKAQESKGFDQKWSAKSLNIPSKSASWEFLINFEKGPDISIEIPGQVHQIYNLPAELRESVLQKIMFRYQNLDMLSYYAIEAEKVLKAMRFHYIPEYRRFLKEVVISVHPSDVISSDPLFRHAPVLSSLPEYTEIHLFAPAGMVTAVKDRLKNLNLLKRSKIYPVELWNSSPAGIFIEHTTTTWATDLFNTSLDSNGNQYLFAPVTRKQIEDLARPDNDYLFQLSEINRRVIRLPVFYRSGNILAGELDETILFMGEEEVANNRKDFFNAVYSYPSDSSFKLLMMNTMGAKKHYVLPNSSNLYHLDLAMVFLDKREVGIIEPLDRKLLKKEDAAVLAEIREKLLSLGFRVIQIPTITKRINAFMSPVNIVLFTNSKDKKRYAIVPEYDDETVHINGSRKQSLNNMIKEAYRKAGITAIFAKDRFHAKNGNIRCAFNVLR